MKNKFLLKLFMAAIIITLCITDVMAFTDDSETIVQEGRGIKVCEYVDPLDNNEIRGRIYYVFKKEDNTNSGAWQVKGRYFASSNMEPIEITVRGNTTNYTYGSFQKVFNGRVYYKENNKYMDSSNESIFECPPYFFINQGGPNVQKYCLDDDEFCGTEFPQGPFKLNIGESVNSIFNIINEYAKDRMLDDEAITIQRQEGDILTYIKNKTMDYVKNTYSFGTTYIMPPFIENYINNKLALGSTSNVDAVKNAINDQIDEDVEKGILTEEEAAKEKEKTEKMDFETALGKISGVGKDLNMCEGDDCNTCHGLLGTDMSKLVKNLFKFVQYLGPILIAAFSIMDFVKAATSGDDGQLKKASSRLMKRIICGVLLFFVPLICSILLDLGGITLTDMCISQNETQETSK